MRKIVALNDPKAVFSELAVQMNESPFTGAAGEIPPLKMAARAASHRTEREVILQTLARNRWNRTRAAQELRISSLRAKLKQTLPPQQDISKSQRVS